ncbi:MAG: hypothetical protein Q8S33_28255 [Myxococcales bacterium]|nr:hypothetical protein [Myxococcales bacterium]MDP3504265.1 hypothetical protein [Myxococcales bacterium]
MHVVSLTPSGTLEVSAASGCVVRDGRVYVIADDDPHLWAFALDGTRLDRHRLLPGVMPLDATERRAVKPDLEALALLPGGGLLALGSGSSPRRRRGALLRDGKVSVVDCTELFTSLEQQFEALNIEAAVVVGDQLVLGQRGNGPGQQNALVRLTLADVTRGLERGAIGSWAVEGIEALDLGVLDGVPLTLTDLSLSLDGELYFAAAAEDTSCVGSIVGVLGPRGVVRRARVAPLVKIEGLAQLDADRWVLVSDADDPAVPAQLLVASANELRGPLQV